jgi:hypothetical protein
VTIFRIKTSAVKIFMSQETLTMAVMQNCYELWINSNYIFNTTIKCTHTVEYVHYYLSNLSYMFQDKLHHPEGELLSFAQNYLPIVMFLK